MTEIQKFPAIQVKKSKVVRIMDEVCVEETCQLFVNEKHLLDLVASPLQLKELCVGYMITEGIINVVDEIKNVAVSGNQVKISAQPTRLMEVKKIESGGGIGQGKAFKKVNSNITIAVDDVFKVISAVQSEEWRKTGGVHCAALFFNNEMVVQSSDIGRHNTIDKVIGFALLNNIDLSSCIVGSTGRQPAGMVAKVANAGIPIIVSKAPSTDKGILLAEQAGITLICFARDERFTVYTHPHRVLSCKDIELCKA